jgi:D-sedoheptulose 7-phosphate isomerase
MLKPLLDRAVSNLRELLPTIAALEPQVQRLGDAMLRCWENGGKLLLAGNGGSAADAMHFAEELAVRFMKNRRALAAMALCDPAAITCAGNDFGFESIFSRQIEALGNEGDIFIALSTSGNSANLVRAVEAAKSRRMTTVSFLGKDGGKLKGNCEIELLVPSPTTARVQEGHKILYHALCEWIESKVE